jgi:hypothetical protein
MRLSNICLRIRLLLCLLPILPSACNKTAVSSAYGAANTSATGDLLVDGGLGTLQSWRTTATYKGIVRSNVAGVTFSDNTQGQYFISQQVNLPAKKFYRVAVTVDYTLNNYSAAGIYVMDSGMSQTLGQFEKVFSSGTGETWEFVFYAKQGGPVTVVIGFLNGINGTATFRNASLTEYDYKPRVSGSAFSAHLSKKFPLVFTAGQYDTTIGKISDYVNSVLLCRYEYFDDTTELPILNQLIGSDIAYTYFNEYRNSLDSITDSYCQKSSLSLGEILTNEFNIPVRQIHMEVGGVGLHQFLEYWNPFAAKWIIIDPCFSTRYEKDGVLLGDEDINQQTAPGYIVRFGQYYYYQTLVPLVQLWQDLEVLDVDDYYTITFPYS